MLARGMSSKPHEALRPEHRDRAGRHPSARAGTTCDGPGEGLGHGVDDGEAETVTGVVVVKWSPLRAQSSRTKWSWNVASAVVAHRLRGVRAFISRAFPMRELGGPSTLGYLALAIGTLALAAGGVFAAGATANATPTGNSDVDTSTGTVATAAIGIMGTLPGCAPYGHSGQHGWVNNNCSYTVHAKIIWAFASDTACYTLNPGDRLDSYRSGQTRYGQDPVAGDTPKLPRWTSVD